MQNYNFNSHQDASDLRDNLGSCICYFTWDSSIFNEEIYTLFGFKSQCLVDT